VRAYVSTVWGCPYEGAVDPAKVLAISERLLELGCYQISLGDTIGVGTPRQTRDIVQRFLDAMPVDRFALHFHDTRGTALANVYAGLQCGVTSYDSSAGGLGGCPYAPGASGNLATEDLLYMLDGLGIQTGVTLSRVVEASRFLAGKLGRRLPSRYLAAVTGRTS